MSEDVIILMSFSLHTLGSPGWARSAWSYGSIFTSGNIYNVFTLLFFLFIPAVVWPCTMGEGLDGLYEVDDEGWGAGSSTLVDRKSKLNVVFVSQVWVYLYCSSVVYK